MSSNFLFICNKFPIEIIVAHCSRALSQLRYGVRINLFPDQLEGIEVLELKAILIGILCILLKFLILHIGLEKVKSFVAAVPVSFIKRGIKR